MGVKLQEKEIYIRHKFQTKKLKRKIGKLVIEDRLMSLREVAKLADVTYKTARKYVASKDPRILSCQRYPEQTGKKRIVYTSRAVSIIQRMKKEAVARRGPKGKRWNWTEEAKRKQSDRHKKGAYRNAPTKRKKTLEAKGLKYFQVVD